MKDDAPRLNPITAPWTPVQVAALNRWQANPTVHPFTCGSGNRMDAAHTTYQAGHPDQDFGQLVASVNGWFCPVCSYRQDWAHAFMADPIVHTSIGDDP
jgi:hypothetical protein